MASYSQVLSERGWGLVESVIMAIALLGMLTPWALTVTTPPDGVIPPWGIAISLVAGTMLALWVFAYLRY